MMLRLCLFKCSDSKKEAALTLKDECRKRAETSQTNRNIAVKYLKETMKRYGNKLNPDHNKDMMFGGYQNILLITCSNWPNELQARTGDT